MRDPHAIDRPRFRLRWLIDRSTDAGGLPEWFTDPRWIPPGQGRLYARAKQGLYAALCAEDETGTVLLPAYVPGGVAWAVLAAGFDVRYYPVSSDLSLPLGAVRDRIEDVDPAAVVFVHYLGFVDEAFEELASAARSRNAIVIEDCARAAFSRDRAGRPLGSIGDLALFCLHKTLPVPNGGLIVSRRAHLPPPGRRQAEWKTLPDAAAVRAARFARISLSPEPEIEHPERVTLSTVAPESPNASPGRLTERGLARCRPGDVQSTRLRRYRSLRSSLGDDPVLDVVTPAAHDMASPYGVAALLPDAATKLRYLRALRRRGLPCEAFTWPPVHRVAEQRSFEGAEALRERLLVFPTHQRLTEADVERIASAIAAESADR
ncbi:DegT/DnrJ/EryC1/StrS family aminotransferase [Halorubrum trueperi]|uniref:DegT/DnrJ/EryC1/StrS family aminotransferase n=1 Tax=Halorubrum trueperi TaxID=2004704 RepID=A0ABD5UJE1_9EURY